MIRYNNIMRVRSRRRRRRTRQNEFRQFQEIHQSEFHKICKECAQDIFFLMKDMLSGQPPNYPKCSFYLFLFSSLVFGVEILHPPPFSTKKVVNDFLLFCSLSIFNFVFWVEIFYHSPDNSTESPAQHLYFIHTV